MATLRVEIELGNDAFQPTPGPEASRLLRKAADWAQYAATGEDMYLYDVNGNKVGFVQVVED